MSIPEVATTKELLAMDNVGTTGETTKVLAEDETAKAEKSTLGADAKGSKLANTREKKEITGEAPSAVMWLGNSLDPDKAAPSRATSAGDVVTAFDLMEIVQARARAARGTDTGDKIAPSRATSAGDAATAFDLMELVRARARGTGTGDVEEKAAANTTEEEVRAPRTTQEAVGLALDIIAAPEPPRATSQVGAYAIAGPGALSRDSSFEIPEHLRVVEEELEGRAPSSDEGLAIASPVDDLPHASDADIEEGRLRKQQQCQKGRQQLAVLVSVVLSLALVIVLSVVLTRGTENEQPTAHPTLAPTLPPTPAPTSRVEALSKALARLLPAVTIQEDTPQSEALQWLVDDIEVNFNGLLPPDYRLLQRFGLVTLYFSTDGDNWVSNDGWLNHSIHECYWTDTAVNIGDACELGADHPMLSVNYSSKRLEDNIHDHLIYLWLQSNGLQGNLPPEIFLSLTTLRTISLAENSELHGPIPTTIGMMTNLEFFHVSAVNMVGNTLPTQLGLLSTSLQSLYLINNGITGTIPSECGHLTALVDLQLDSNNLHGTLPSELSAVFENLRVLYLQGNALTGTILDLLGNNTNLEEIILSENQFTGTLPSQLGLLRNVWRFDVSTNQLTGILPTELGSWSHIHIFRLGVNQLSGSLPSQLGQLSRISFFSFDDNQFSGPIPSELGLLTTIDLMIMLNNRFSGPLPSELGLLSKIEYLYLGSNQFNGTVPTEIGQLSLLKYFAVDDNNLSGHLPTELGRMNNSFETLDLNYNQLTGPLPSELGLMSNMLYLFFRSNQFSGAVPTEIGQLSSLKYFVGDDNILSGHLPTELGNVSNSFELLELSGNTFTGPLTQFASPETSHVWYYGASQNLLTGSIHESYGFLSALSYFNITGNPSLSGFVPGNLCNATSIAVLDFDCSPSLCGCDCDCQLD